MILLLLLLRIHPDLACTNAGGRDGTETEGIKAPCCTGQITSPRQLFSQTKVVSLFTYIIKHICVAIQRRMPSKVTDNKNTSLEDIFTTPKNFTSFKKFMKMKEFQRSEFLQKHIVDLRVVCPSRQKSCHMSSERIGTLHKWTGKNLNNSFEE